MQGSSIEEFCFSVSLNKPIIKYKLEQVPANSYVLIDATRADFIDKDIIEEINNFMLHAGLKNISVEIKLSQHKPMHNLFTQNTPKLQVA